MKQPSEKCLQLVKHFEGCKLKSYKDVKGIWTIGWGLTHLPDGKSVIEGEVITQERADFYLWEELCSVFKSVMAYYKQPFTQDQLDAFASLAYNIGLGAFKKSTLLGAANINPDDPEIDSLFLRFVWSGGKPYPGLVRRRMSEFHLYSTGEIKTDWPDAEITRIINSKIYPK